MIRALAQGDRTPRQLREATGLAARTLRYALSRLKEEGLVEERRSLRDARRKVFALRAGEG